LKRKKHHKDLKEEEEVFEEFLSFPFTIIDNLALKIVGKGCKER